MTRRAKNAMRKYVRSRSRDTGIFAFTCIVLLVGLGSGSAQAVPAFSDWPAGTAPAEVGKRLAQKFAASPYFYPTGPIGYPEVCMWYGALSFADVTGDKALATKLVRRFEPIMTPPGHDRIPPVVTVDEEDNEVFGVTPLEIYRQTKQAEYLKFGKTFADRQWESPRSDGLSRETRFWIDDMYMITMLQVEAYRATGERKYVDRAALEMAAYLDKLHQPNGLFYHRADSPFFWGRGNGWVAAGMAELLRSLPADNPHHERILAGYRKMMKALLQFQAKDGAWRELVDDDAAWEETSATGMFTFTMITGVKNGWLDENVYGPAARGAWLALVGFIDQNDNMTSVCETTDPVNSKNFYLMRKRKTGDPHGEAPVLWAAAALLR
jgi:unsaturated rhamnogalacturonyl hydrolase